MLSLQCFGDEKITALTMNNYFSIKISNKQFRSLTKFFQETKLMPHTVGNKKGDYRKLNF